MAEGCGKYEGDLTSDGEFTTATIKRNKQNKRKQAPVDCSTPVKATRLSVACFKQATPALAAGGEPKIQAVVLHSTFRRHVKEFPLKHIKLTTGAIEVAQPESINMKYKKVNTLERLPAA